jgi:hypothetical protein
MRMFQLRLLLVLAMTSPVGAATLVVSSSDTGRMRDLSSAGAAMAEQPVGLGLADNSDEQQVLPYPWEESKYDHSEPLRLKAASAAHNPYVAFHTSHDAMPDLDTPAHWDLIGAQRSPDEIRRTKASASGLPETYRWCVWLAIFGTICLALLGTIRHYAGKIPFALYSLDFGIGMVVASMMCTFALGPVGVDGLAVINNLDTSGVSSLVFGIIAAVTWTAGSILFNAGADRAGLAVVYSVAGAFWIGLGGGIPLLLLHGFRYPLVAGSIVVLISAAVISVVAYFVETDRRAVGQPPQQSKWAMARTISPGSSLSFDLWRVKNLVPVIMAGVLWAVALPFAKSSQGAKGVDLGPYAIGFMVGVAALCWVIGRLAYSLFSRKLTIREIVGVPLGKRLLGIAGGMLSTAGIVATLVAASAGTTPNFGPRGSTATSFDVPFLGTLIALVICREYRGAGAAFRRLTGATVLLQAIAVILLSISPGS